MFFSCQYRDILHYNSIATPKHVAIFCIVFFTLFDFVFFISFRLVYWVWLFFYILLTLSLWSRDYSCYFVNNLQIYIKAIACIACACYLYFFVSLCVIWSLRCWTGHFFCWVYILPCQTLWLYFFFTILFPKCLTMILVFMLCFFGFSSLLLVNDTRKLECAGSVYYNLL